MDAVIRILALATVAFGSQSSAREDCVRGPLAPVLVRPSGQQKYSFVKSADDATEQLAMDDKTALSIRHFGCAHYALEFSFVLTGEKPGDHQPNEWLARAAVLFDRLEERPGSLRLSQVAERLRRAAAEPYEYGTPLSIPSITSLTFDVRAVAQGTKLVLLYDVAL